MKAFATYSYHSQNGMIMVFRVKDSDENIVFAEDHRVYGSDDSEIEGFNCDVFNSTLDEFCQEVKNKIPTSSEVIFNFSDICDEDFNIFRAKINKKLPEYYLTLCIYD